MSILGGNSISSHLSIFELFNQCQNYHELIRSHSPNLIIIPAQIEQLKVTNHFIANLEKIPFIYAFLDFCCCLTWRDLPSVKTIYIRAIHIKYLLILSLIVWGCVNCYLCVPELILIYLLLPATHVYIV